MKEKLIQVLLLGALTAAISRADLQAERIASKRRLLATSAECWRQSGRSTSCLAQRSEQKSEWHPCLEVCERVRGVFVGQYGDLHSEGAGPSAPAASTVNLIAGWLTLAEY